MQISFQDFLLDHDVVGFNEKGFKLKSGKVSYWYANFRNLSRNLDVLEKTADYVVEFLLSKELIDQTIDGVLGVPEAATLLGQKVSENLIEKGLLSNVIYSLRVNAKTHGDPADRFWTNGNIPKRVLILEDVTTTGGSALQLVDKLLVAQVEVVTVISLLNRLQLDERGESVLQKMKQRRLKYFCLTDASQILPYALSKLPAAERESLAKKLRSEYLSDYQSDEKLPVNF